MNKVIEIFDDAIQNWRLHNGIGTALIPFPLDDKLMILGILQRFYIASNINKTIIITPNFNQRSDIIEYITSKNLKEEENEKFKDLIKSRNILIFTENFINESNFNVYPNLIIWYKPTSFKETIVNVIKHCQFKLIVLNKRFTEEKDMVNLYKEVPLLSNFNQANIDEIRTSTPVEETLIPVSIDKDSEDFKLLNYYNEYIATSLNIFGSFEIMQEVNTGNIKLNISSYQICYKIATENGWNENLDMSIEFNQEIDKLYNPIALRERASNTYEIIRNRSKLLANYKDKLSAIFSIIKDNPNKKTLIINKNGLFASEVTEYINNLSETIVCMNYHDKVDNIPAVTIDGEPIVYKSGSKKGQRKMMGSKAQKTYAETMFNINRINILSANSSPDKELNIYIELVIITSPMCESIKNYIYRLSKCNFGNKIKLYTLYCKNTQEEKLIQNKELLLNHNVKNSDLNENNYDFIVVD